MFPFLILTAILLPILGGICIPLFHWKNRNQMLVFTECLVLITSLLSAAMILNCQGQEFTLIAFSERLRLSFRIDGLSRVFMSLISILWPLATIYSFEYMKHEEHEKIFFMFYVGTFGITIGIASAENLFAMYVFYEMLTLITLPLVMHTLTKEAIRAGKQYVYYSLGGAAFAFMSVVFLMVYGNGAGFTMGGALDPAKVAGHERMLKVLFVLGFFGFGVKAAVFPFYSWLPAAGVAPTPVTALLHAVAVVKSGAFAVIRLIYYCYGTEYLSGTWAQHLVLLFAAFTIVFGCSNAVKETHLKRRLAFSTVGNLSYILFGAALMSPAGMVGAMAHMICHGFMKICGFFCVGAIMYKTGSHDLSEIKGYAKRMPVVFTCFLIASLALAGMPGFCGFVSKWQLGTAGVASGSVFGYLGTAALGVSALLTVIYMFGIVFQGFFPEKEFDVSTLDKKVEDPNWLMKGPLICFCIAMVFLGLHSTWMLHFFEKVAAGLL